MDLTATMRRLISNPSVLINYPQQKLEDRYDKYVWTPLYSTNVFEAEWDLCVVLDACRVDMAKRATDQRSWLPNPETRWSVGSNSTSWYERTVSGAKKDILADTALISGNPHSDVVRDIDWGLLDEVWTYAFDEEFGTTLPRPITDRAISVSRDYNMDRLLIHYMQPHLPPVQTSAPDLGWNPETQDWHDGDPWTRAANGELDPEYVERLYRENLDPVLDDVALLLDNVEAETAVITADHGNYVGENDKWSHPLNDRGLSVRQVPWWETTATDKGTHEPESYDRSTADVSQMDQLKALGYR